ncbi:MAG: hypothetical protein COV99_09465 [Bacteroidetes bacterium CG12_big_fil_rev_8_21_14_0_65_60_17]|nr:MAG: hypothetical protein COV99_09465 [Bacteroidetes bacterium CG12_big_fil_rev_8_21_14_0_65_60_17]
MYRIPALVFTLVAIQLAACSREAAPRLVPPSERDDRAAEAFGPDAPVLAKLDGSFRLSGLDAETLGAPVTWVAIDSLGDLGLIQFETDGTGELPGAFNGRPLQQEQLAGGLRVASTRTEWMRAIGLHLTGQSDGDGVSGRADSLQGLPPLAREVAAAPSWVLVRDMALAGRVAPPGIRDIPQIGQIMGRFDAIAVGVTPRSDTLHVELTGQPVEGASATQIAGLLSAAALFAGMQSTLPDRIRDIIRSTRVTTRRNRVVVTATVVNQTPR